MQLTRSVCRLQAMMAKEDEQSHDWRAFEQVSGFLHLLQENNVFFIAQTILTRVELTCTGARKMVRFGPVEEHGRLEDNVRTRLFLDLQ